MDTLAVVRTLQEFGYLNWRLCRYPDSATVHNGTVSSRYIVELDRGFDMPDCLHGAVTLIDERLRTHGATPPDFPHYRVECLLDGDWRIVQVLLPKVPLSPETDRFIWRYLALCMQAVQPHRRRAAMAGRQEHGPERWQDLQLALLGQAMPAVG